MARGPLRHISVAGEAFRKMIVWTSADENDIALSPTQTAGTGVPTALEPKGSSYQRINGAGAGAVMYVATDAIGTWSPLAANDGTAVIADVGTYYTVDTVNGALDALGLQIGGDTDATYNFTNGTGSLVADNDAVYAALNKLDQGFVSLKAVTNAKGASLVGIEDAATLFTATNVESALLELIKYVPVAAADPGNAGAIEASRSATVMMTSAGAETRTLAIPTFVGQTLRLVDAVHVGNIVVTASFRINQAGNTIMTFGAVGDFIELVAVTIGGALRWQVSGNDAVGTVALS